MADIATVVFIASGILLMLCSVWAVVLRLRHGRRQIIARLLVADAALLVLLVAAFVVAAA